MIQQTEDQTNPKSRFKQALKTIWDKGLIGKLLVTVLCLLGVALATYVLYLAANLWLFLLIPIIPVLMILVFLPPFSRFLYHRIGRLNRMFGFRSGKPLRMAVAILAYGLLSAVLATLIVVVGNSMRNQGAVTAIRSMTATPAAVAQATKLPSRTPELSKPTLTPAPSGTSIPPSAVPVPTSTPQPTVAPTATEVVTNTPSSAKVPVPTKPPATEPASTDETIVDVPEILGKSAAAIEKSLGKSTEIQPMRVGDAEELPDGGESRTYTRGKYTFYLFFDRNSAAKGFQLIEGLGESYRLGQSGDLLKRFGFSVFKLPDVEAPAARRWNNFNGYKIAVIASSINGPVWSVQIWRLR